MDEAQLRRYRILTRLGVYSVDRFSRAGIRAFLRYTADLLEAAWAARGLDHTAGRDRLGLAPPGALPDRYRTPRAPAPGFAVVPVAIVYEFLDEPRPEIFVKFGPPRIFRADGERRQRSPACSSATSSGSSTPSRRRCSTRDVRPVLACCSRAATSTSARLRPRARACARGSAERRDPGASRRRRVRSAQGGGRS